MREELQVRLHGDAELPALIYLPGLHGDWTLVGDFRKNLAGKVRFVEFTYPRTLEWSLDDYAAAIENALVQNEVRGGWLLGESFGSQILWMLVRRRRLEWLGLILAGGFVRHPTPWAARGMERCSGRLTLALLMPMLKSYGKIARWRYRHAPVTLAGIQEFIVRRTPADFRAARHRLHLLAENDPRMIASMNPLPLYYLTGGFDPIVPWPFVQDWLKKNCPSLRAVKIIRGADHNVLGTSPEQSAKAVLGWMELCG